MDEILKKQALLLAETLLSEGRCLASTLIRDLIAALEKAESHGIQN